MSLPRGVFLADAPGNIPPYRTSGWRMFRVRGGATKREALAALGRALRLPDWYGQNLDALWDCITDLTEPTVLVWSGWEQLAVSDPESWAAIVGILRERAELDPAFAVWCVLSRNVPTV